MSHFRIIPCLLLKNKGLVKTIKFQNPKYVGDPINAVRIFNEKEVDELIFLDIEATLKNVEPDYKFIQQIASQAFMPFCYGGGVRDIESMRKLYQLGVEKVALNSIVYTHPQLISEAASIFGSQSIVASIDVKKNVFGKYQIYAHSGKKKQKIELLPYIKYVEQLGAGELLVNFINHDGMRQGYDVDLVRTITSHVNIPVIALGGAGDLQHMADVIEHGGANAAAAGSMFVFHGKHQAVLINYPSQDKIKSLFHTELA